MITKIEIDGFKSFQNFKIELGPFQVIVGQNGVGKSNLFDALHLLSLLTDHDLRSAFQMMRGESHELFTTLPNTDPQTEKVMTFAIEMLLDSSVEDDLGNIATLENRRLRYELAISRKGENGLSQLQLEKEQLISIESKNDTWYEKYASNLFKTKTTSTPETYIAYDNSFSNPTTVLLFQEPREKGKPKRINLAKTSRAIFSTVEDVSFPHAFAVRQEMRSWRFLQLNSELLRKPASMSAQAEYLLPDGSNLPTVLARMENQDKFALNDVSLDLANLVSGVINVKLDKNEARQENMLQIEMQDGRTFSSRLLSDGTLRMLALAALRNDSQERGVLCLEEPENGVHPQQLKRLVSLLRDTATDFSDPEQAGEPLRQVLINTHSPVLVSQLVNLASEQPDGSSDITKELLFAYTTTTQIEVGDKKQRIRITRIVPPKPDDEARNVLDIDQPEAFFTARQIISYLDSGQSGEAEASFREAVGV